LYTRSVDLWAFGCLLFEVATGNKPFTSKVKKQSKKEIFIKIINGQINKFPEKIDPALKDLILKLIVPDPKKRLGSNSILELTTHPYFKDCFDSENKLVLNLIKTSRLKIVKKVEIKNEKPIPYELFLRMENWKANTTNSFAIDGFSCLKTSEQNG
jgi:serine/threonine protein kinase